MEHLDEIVRLAENEFDAIAKNGKFRSREEIDSVYKLMDIVKDANEIMCMEEDGSYRGESYRYPVRESYRGSYRESYRDDGMSYARGRKRDSMGRYSRAYRGYSGKEDYIENLRGMMEDAPDEQTRQSIQRMIQQMENQ